MRGVEAVRRGSSTLWPDGPSGLRVACGRDVIQGAWEELEDLPQPPVGLGLVAGSRTDAAPVVELRPRVRGPAPGLAGGRRGAVAATPRKGRGIELTLVLFGAGIALTLALLPGPLVAGLSSPHAGRPAGGRCVECAPSSSSSATAPPLWRSGEPPR